MVLDNIAVISIAVIAAIMVVAVLFQIPMLLQIRRTAREAEKTLEVARTQIAPLSHDLTVISQEVKNILQSIGRQVNKVEESVTTVRDTAVRLRDFEEEIIRRVEEPLLDLSNLVSSMIRGAEAFVRIFRR